MTTTAILYTRISDDREGLGLGVQRQHDDLTKLAKREGWDIVGDFTDNDIGAYKGKKRPAWIEAIKLIEAGAVDVLATWASDRLTRHPRELEDLVDLLEETDTKVVTATSGEYDLTTPEGRAYARIVGAIARQESERKSVRTKAKWQQSLKNGDVQKVGVRPFGYEHDQITIVDVEADLVREGYALVASGGSLGDVWRMFTDSATPTTEGNEWTKIAINRILRSPRYAALRTYKGEIIGEAPWPAIIEMPLWEKAQAMIKARSNPDRRPSRKYLLTGGIARCGKCGTALVSRPTGSKKPAYICPPAEPGQKSPGCGSLKILAEYLETEVERQVLEVFNPELVNDALVEYTGQIDAVEVAAEIHNLEASLEELSKDYYSARMLTRSQFDAAHAELTARLELARRSLVPPNSGLVIDGDLGEWWQEASAADRRQIVQLVVESVSVAGAVRGRNTFDPERISINWHR